VTPAQLSELRNRLGLSQAQLAELLGVHPLTVSKWERGLLQPSPYQESLLDSFAKARKANKDIGKEAKEALLAAGVIVALVILLNAALSEKK
jgi:DNA-binding transcriptional regulator YiaG